MKKNTSHVTVDIPFLVARQFPDPFDDDIVTHTLYVDTREIPTIPNDANARRADAGINRAVYKAVANSAMDGKINPDEELTPGLFGYKHLGVNILADKVVKLNDHTARVLFRKPDADRNLPGDGSSNGGHGIAILKKMQKEFGAKGMPPNFIRVNITTGIPREATAEIAGGNNASVQVQSQSLVNLAGKFEKLKEALKGSRLDGKVSWREDDDGEISVIDIIATMTCFRIDLFPTEGLLRRMPVHAYERKSIAMMDFRNDPEGYYKLLPILNDILELTDIVRTGGREPYNSDGKKYGLLKFVDKAPAGKPYVMAFTGESVEYRLNMAAVFPILAAFRLLVEERGGKFRWVGGFNSIKKLWQTVAPEIIEATKEACADKGYVLNGLGKSRTHWANIQRIVETAVLRRRIANKKSAA